jgi:hypothetical protein
MAVGFAGEIVPAIPRVAQLVEAACVKPNVGMLFPV